jgi:hypothetical protein
MPLVHLLSKYEKAADELGSLFNKQSLNLNILYRDKQNAWHPIPPPYKNDKKLFIC